MLDEVWKLPTDFDSSYATADRLTAKAVCAAWWGKGGNSFPKSKGIFYQFTQPDIPEHSTIQELMRLKLQSNKMNKQNMLLGEALNQSM